MNNPRHLLRKFLLQRKWAYVFSVLSIILSEIVTVQFPHVLGAFTNTWHTGRLSAQAVSYYSLMLLAIGVGYVILYGFGQWRNGQLGRQFEYELRQQLFLHWERLSASYFRHRSIGDLLNHAMNDVRTVREALSGGLNILTNAIFLLIATLIMTFRINVELTLLSMIPILLIPVFVIWWGPRIRNASRQVQESLSDMADLTEESLSAIRLIKATSNEEVETGRFEQRVDSILSRQMVVFRQSALFQSMIPLMGSLSFVVALAYGGYLTVEGRIQLGGFVAFTLYLAMLITPLQQMGFVFNYFQRASASLKRLEVLFGEVPEITNPETPDSVTSISGELSLRLRSFQYADADRPALHDISFSVERGQTVGIVGRTAAGKTTLVNLLPRIFDPDPGSVFVDGHDVRQLPLQVLREAIAYVPQDGFLFSATVGENIGFSKANASVAQIEMAAADAAMLADIERFESGLATVIGERGVTLSGGQKQRTALARAFLKDAPILIMDDSLSAVDMNTEKQILSRIAAIRRNKTTLIVAHRLSAVRHADFIVVLDNGRLVEQGTHDELLQQDGIYAAMHQLQTQGEEVVAE